MGCERVSQYEFYSSNSKYRGYIILIKKASGATASNILCHDSDTMIFDLALPGGILINTAALYGPNGDDDQYWSTVKSILDKRTGDGKMMTMVVLALMIMMISATRRAVTTVVTAAAAAP